ncbi:putative guanylate-binding protein/Atlastin [Helianthus annuus]|nr:putative guanylate-binding protein/Atlastin [Helianthus annuus]
MDKLRPEFKSGLDALTRFVFERTRPKQVGATVMTGPIFAGITQSFLDALNNDVVPTITSSWQSVEETKCKRAVEYATEVYKSSFDSSKPVLSPLKKRQYEKHMKKLFRRLWLPLIQLLLELVLKIGKLTLARLLMAYDAMMSSDISISPMTHVDEVLQLYSELMKLDPTHYQCYKDEYSLVFLKQVIQLISRLSTARLNLQCDLL